MAVHRCGHDDCFSCPFDDCIVDVESDRAFNDKSADQMSKEERRRVKQKEYARKSYLKNKEKYQASMKSWRDAHPNYRREYYETHREQEIDRVKIYRQKRAKRLVRKKDLENDRQIG